MSDTRDRMGTQRSMGMSPAQGQMIWLIGAALTAPHDTASGVLSFCGASPERC